MNVRVVLGMALAAGFLALATSGARGAIIDNGNGLIYDSITDLTWYQNSGALNWTQANGWAQGLDAGAVTGWRLPWYPQTPDYTFDPDDATVGELAQLRADLGNAPGSDYTNAGPFDPTNWYAGGYWTSNKYNAHLTTLATAFGMGHGNIGNNGIGAGAFAFAVHEGNIGAAPEPAALSLLALGGLLMLRRRK